MSDLISRSALIKTLETYKFGVIQNEVERAYIKETVINFVKDAPTAYNTEKVVAELEEYRDFITIQGRKFVDTAIDIVKRGGAE